MVLAPSAYTQVSSNVGPGVVRGPGPYIICDRPREQYVGLGPPLLIMLGNGQFIMAPSKEVAKIIQDALSNNILIFDVGWDHLVGGVL